jgi:hypothetical protein
MDGPPPPQLTVEQTADLKCLGAALFVAKDGSSPTVRIYLDRLRRTDRTRNWKAEAPKPSGDMLYGDFMGLMNECQDRLQESKRRR